MKKRLIVLFLMLFAFVSVRVGAQEHMMFMKTPIDGTITEFASKMKAKGFVQTEVAKDVITMEGDFMGQACELYIIGTEKTKTVWQVSVWFDEKYTSWYDLKSDYNDIKDSYIGKYGVQTNNYHFFVKPYYEGDGYEMQAVKLDKCRYGSFWDKEDGNIMISIEKFAQISITYQDRLNNQKRKIEKKAQINEDI